MDGEKVMSTNKLREVFSLKSHEKKIDILYLLALFILNICVNSFMQIKLLYRDDLCTWVDFSKMTALEMIFNTAANKFRPVYYFVLKLCYKFFLPRVYLFGVFTLMLNFLIIALIFYAIKKITNNSLISFFGAIIYTFSRFAYYSISQVHGIMEEMALGVAILILFLLWQYIIKNNMKYFYVSSALLFIIPLIHERYMVLYALLVLALILAPKAKKYAKLKGFIISTLSFVVPFVIRCLVLKNRAFDGTGGTDIKETFSVNSMITYFKNGIRYMLGRNDGPAYLNGIEQVNALGWIRALNIVFTLVVLFTICLYVYLIIKNRSKKEELKLQIITNILIMAFIFLCLICSCTTIRLEMRWLYSPYVGCIILMSNALAYINKYIGSHIYVVIMAVLLCITIPTELYFRSNYRNLYYWWDYQLYNSVYDQTIGRYKQNFWGKKIIFVSKNAGTFGENGEELKESFRMIRPDCPVEIEIYDSIDQISSDDFNEMTIILGIDTYNQKVINLEDLQILAHE